MNFALDFVAAAVDDANPVATNLGEVTLLKIDEPLGHGQQRRHTAGNVVGIVTEANDQRAGNAADDDAIGIFGIDNEQRKRALELFYRLAHGLDEIEALLQVIVDKVCRDFGIGSESNA